MEIDCPFSTNLSRLLFVSGCVSKRNKKDSLPKSMVWLNTTTEGFFFVGGGTCSDKCTINQKEKRRKIENQLSFFIAMLMEICVYWFPGNLIRYQSHHDTSNKFFIARFHFTVIAQRQFHYNLFYFNSYTQIFTHKDALSCNKNINKVITLINYFML